MTGRNEHTLYAANIFISKAIRTKREMITKRISGQQKQPGSFILQAGPYQDRIMLQCLYAEYTTVPYPHIFFVDSLKGILATEQLLT